MTHCGDWLFLGSVARQWGYLIIHSVQLLWQGISENI